MRTALYVVAMAAALPLTDQASATQAESPPVARRVFTPPSSKPAVSSQTVPADEADEAEIILIDSPVANPPVPIPAAAPATSEAGAGGQIMARRKIQEAFELGSRGALFAARARFFEGLRLLADQRDAVGGTTEHRDSLAAALRALGEADDFVRCSESVSRVIDVTAVARGHETAAARSLTPQATAAQALARYYSFAVDQFGRAFPESPDASTALFGLGKVYEQLEKGLAPQSEATASNPMVFYRAALAVDPKNWRAANELGVCLARAEQWQDAAYWLKHCLKIVKCPEADQNLAVVTRHLRTPEAAQQGTSWLGGSSQAIRANKPTVKWVTPAEMASGVQQQGTSVPISEEQDTQLVPSGLDMPATDSSTRPPTAGVTGVQPGREPTARVTGVQAGREPTARVTGVQAGREPTARVTGVRAGREPTARVTGVQAGRRSSETPAADCQDQSESNSEPTLDQKP